MKKRLMSLLLTMAMLVTLLGGCGDNTKTPETQAPGKNETQAPVNTEAQTQGDATEKTYDEKISFSMTGYNTITGENYTSDALAQWIMQKFNVDVTVANNETQGAAERFSTAAISGTLSDVNLQLGFSWETYYNFVDQGLYQPLPDGWETRWPNLAKMVELSGFADYLKVDGLTYAIPHTTFGNMTKMDSVTQHISLYWRKDLAEAVGMSDLGADGTIKLSELEEYLTKVAGAGLIEKPILGGHTTALQRFFKWSSGCSTEPFMVGEDGYSWTPTQDCYINALTNMQEWYKKGLVDQEFYNNDQTYYQNAFKAGQIPAMYMQGNNGGVQSFSEVEGVDRSDIGVAVLRAEDGTVYAMEITNYWLATVFAPQIEEKTMERVLDMMDWACTEEGQITCSLPGVPEVDWKYTSDGKIEVINDTDYNSYFAFFMLGYCGDDVSCSGLLKQDEVSSSSLDIAMSLYEIRGKGVLIELPRAYMVYSGEAKTDYTAAVSMNNFETGVVCGTEDVEGSVKDFVEEHRNVWEPLENEVNEVAKSFQ